MHGELTYPDVNYKKLLQKECWKKLHNYIYSKDFIDKIFSYFKNELNTQQDLLFDINNFEFVLEYEGRNIKKKYDLKNNKNILHTRLDLGYGKTNMVKKVGVVEYI